MEQGVWERGAGGDRISLLQQLALQAQSSGTSVPQPDEFDGHDNKFHDDTLMNSV